MREKGRNAIKKALTLKHWCQLTLHLSLEEPKLRYDWLHVMRGTAMFHEPNTCQDEYQRTSTWWVLCSTTPIRYLIGVQVSGFTTTARLCSYTRLDLVQLSRAVCNPNSGPDRALAHSIRHVAQMIWQVRLLSDLWTQIDLPQIFHKEHALV